MKKFMQLVLVGALMTFLVGCGVKTADYEAVVSERNNLRVQKAEKSALLEKAVNDLEAKKRVLAEEVKSKQAHAVREEQAKQRLKQAERDLASALRQLSVCKGKKK